MESGDLQSLEDEVDFSLLSTIRAPAGITRTHPVKSVYGCVCWVGQAEAVREAEQSVCQRWRAGW